MADNKHTKKIETTEIPPESVVKYFNTFEFSRLPRKSKKSPAEADAATWRIVLISLITRQDPLALEIFDDVVIGRKMNRQDVDLDLSIYNALELGVSRVHARLHPTAESLLLYDMNSTNGTYCNALKATADEPVKLKDNDIISFGALKFLLKVVRQPQRPTG